ncbi:Na+/H+ antiporter NhaA [Zymobacter sp. IVIA_12111.31 C1]|uniref:Na+/H+ antiporter NhaA n=1 Tax=Zymobacter sp. IVIA_12111.31 C1 TaxID=3394854 RepID=UPI0039C173C1
MSSTSLRHQPRWKALIYHPTTGGIVLIIASLIAILLANSPWQSDVQSLLHHPVMGRSVAHWINDGLMSVFFLGVGLEIKAELCEGQLARWGARALPGLAALGGMVVPALVFALFNAHQPQTLKGWAIPSATDIAFALTVITLLGKRVPASLRTFLAALAIIDDLGAIVIIACFYTQSLAWGMLAGAGGAFAVLIVFNRLGIRALLPYLLVGGVLWYCMAGSGLHATLAGVLLALCIPRTAVAEGRASPLHRLSHALTPWIALLVLPLFGLANAGVTLSPAVLHHLLSPVPLGVMLGLLIGKPLGIFGMTWLTIRLRIAPMPAEARWSTLLATAMLCGIGFTMSLFIGGLAYASSPEYLDEVKIGVLAGSLLSTLLGVVAFRAITTTRRS